MKRKAKPLKSCVVWSDPELLSQAFARFARTIADQHDELGDGGAFTHFPELQKQAWNTAMAWRKMIELLNELDE